VLHAQNPAISASNSAAVSNKTNVPGCRVGNSGRRAGKEAVFSDLDFVSLAIGYGS
jgi:hypothetical protein